MALSDEQTRAARYNAAIEARRRACLVRAYQLQGNGGSRKSLEDRTIAVTREENNAEKQKIGSKISDDGFVECNGDAINGGRG